MRLRQVGSSLHRKKGWTSDLIGFEWLKSHFQSFVSQTSNSRHLLIIDGHSSHVTARFIAYCITSKIDLFLLPPHSLHKTQPLNLSIFGPLKTALNLEVDRTFQHLTMRLLRVEWTSTYIKARARYFLSNLAFERLESIRSILRSCYRLLRLLLGPPLQEVKLLVKLVTHLGS